MKFTDKQIVFPLLICLIAGLAAGLAAPEVAFAAVIGTAIGTDNFEFRPPGMINYCWMLSANDR